MSRKQLILIGFATLTGLFLIVALSKTGRKLVTETWNIVSNLGVNLIARMEGFESEAYQDQAGLWTIGYGHKIKPGENFYPYGDVKNITVEDAKKLLAQDMQQSADVVNRYVKVPLNEQQFNALVSFVFNTSSTDESRFANSTLVKKLNKGDYIGAAEELNKWVYITKDGKKVVSNGLVARRETEKNLFLS